MPKARIQISTTPPSNEGPSPDAWLIECCHEWAAIDGEDDRLYRKGENEPHSPEDIAHSRFVSRTLPRKHELEETIFFTRALTQKGLHAKAAVAFKRTMRDAEGEPVPEDWASASLAKDILQGVAA
jgi:hypothetical protein